MRLIIPSIFLIIIFDYSCERENDGHPGEKLAIKYCSSCHIYPEPDLLTSEVWTFQVLPRMGQRLGMKKYAQLYYEPIEPQLAAPQPLLSQQEWEQIVQFYHEAAPAELSKTSDQPLASYDREKFKAVAFPGQQSENTIISLIHFDQNSHHIMLGDVAEKHLNIFNPDGVLLNEIQLASPATAIHVDSAHLDVLEAGMLHPNDLPLGQLTRLGKNNLKESQVLIDSLYRPVHATFGDLNNDSREDMVICQFGHHKGKLSYYLQQEDGTYRENVLSDQPGAINTCLLDFNKDGQLDILALFAQGDERIVLYQQHASGGYAARVLKQFPPVYGSMYMEVHDFNQDGLPDILYVNGDNFDYSKVLKPYHGIRILEQTPEGYLNEAYFYPMHGAAKAMAFDFDQDQDLDIVAGANFPGPNQEDEAVFYLQNQGKLVFIPYKYQAGAWNQWNTMDLGDLDQDGDMDVILGAMNLESILKDQQNQIDSTKSPVSVLILENQFH